MYKTKFLSLYMFAEKQNNRFCKQPPKSHISYEVVTLTTSCLTALRQLESTRHTNNITLGEAVSRCEKYLYIAADGLIPQSNVYYYICFCLPTYMQFLVLCISAAVKMHYHVGLKYWSHHLEFDWRAQKSHEVSNEFRVSRPSGSRHQIPICETFCDRIRIFPVGTKEHYMFLQCWVCCTSFSLSPTSPRRQWSNNIKQMSFFQMKTQMKRWILHILGLWSKLDNLNFSGHSIKSKARKNLEGEDDTFSTPAAAKICWPWQMEAMGFCVSAKWWAMLNTFSFSARYSGERPPGMTNASYDSASTSLKDAVRVKSWPGFSLYVCAPSKSWTAVGHLSPVLLSGHTASTW